MEDNLYQIRYYSDTNKLLLLDVPFMELEYGQIRNDVGAAVLVIPLEFWDSNIFRWGSFMEIWRFDYISNSYQLIGDTVWLLLKWTVSLSKQQVELEFRDLNYLLTIRGTWGFAYVDSNVWQSLQTVNSYEPGINTSGLFQGLDDIMKYLVSYCFLPVSTDVRNLETNRTISAFAGYNYPAIPYSDRINTKVEIAPFISQAPIKSFYVQPEENLHDTLKRISTISENLGYPLEFRFRYSPSADSNVGGTFLFETAVPGFGQDLTEIVNLSNDSGALKDAELIADYTSFVSLAFGIGSTSDQWLTWLNLTPVDNGVIDFLIATAENQDFNLPDHNIGIVEGRFPLSDELGQYDLFAIENYAIQQIYANKPKVQLTGDITQQSNFAFLHDYKFLDTVKISGFGYDFSSRIDKYTVTVNATEEKIRVPFIAIQQINQVTTTITHP